MAKIKTIGKVLYWTMIPVMLAFLIYGNYLVLDSNLWQHTAIFGHIDDVVGEVCTPRTF